ncbi:MAG: phosphate acyltransferase PlsX [Rhodospirillales bacterium]|nr:phosphate acyltransferase PlsX [Rhodospirillales bacterium]
MSKPQIMALDAMGGDFGPAVVVPAAALAVKKLGANVHFLFYGDENEINRFLGKYPRLKALSTIHHTDKKISSADKPSAAVRASKDTSMRLAIEAVKDGQAQSVVSAGNTGALMALSKMILKCLPGIDRPAIASVLPTEGRDTVMLDLGANLVCDEEMLVQFAVLGAVYARAVSGIERPSVGLLNIGTEDMKGHDEIRAAAGILSGIDFPGSYHGFVEGNDIAKGTVDVVVTDGFTGNVALKVAEGVGSLTRHFLRDAFKSSPLAMLGAMLASGALKRMKKRVDPRFYNGGMFLGLDGICVKSHGGMDEYGFYRAIRVAYNLVEQGYNKRVATEISHVMEQETEISARTEEKETAEDNA